MSKKKIFPLRNKININIAVSIGDVNGIGLEIFFKSLLNNQIIKNGFSEQYNINYKLFANDAIILEYLEKSKFFENYKNEDLSLEPILDLLVNDLILNYKNLKKFINIEVIDISILIKETSEINSNFIEFGKVTKLAGEIAHKSFVEAAKSVIQNKNNILVTLPISKEAVYLSGWDFPGHTEYIEYLENTHHNSFDINSEDVKKQPLMIISTKYGKVALVTIHIPIAKVSENINQNLILDKFEAFYKSLKNDYNITNPKIAILGLNPHSGENGNIGVEEKNIISPLIQILKSNSDYKDCIDYDEPFPADGFFAQKLYLNYDGVLAMYHDQGLIPFKMLADGGGVNFTANQSIVRTSPDHGTAFGIAGKNIANPQSTIDAILEGIEIYINRKNQI